MVKTFRNLGQGDGFVAWEGRSPVTGDPIVLIVTGGSTNEKTGPMAQAWLLLRDVPPVEAMKTSVEAAICGFCNHRGNDDGGHGRTCYVNLFMGAKQIWDTYKRGRYPILTAAGARERMRGVFLRVTAYGDPAFVPFTFWTTLLAACGGHVGYTHQWRTCDRRFRQVLMASVDSDSEQEYAASKGWRTFRDRKPGQPVLDHEFICPASAEGGHRATCLTCGLCGGNDTPARNVVILRHGRDAQRGKWNKHGEVFQAVMAGQRFEIHGEERDRNRVSLALRMRGIRQGLGVIRFSSRIVRPGVFEFWKGDQRGAGVQ